MKKLAFLLALALSTSAYASTPTPAYELRVYTPGLIPTSGTPATPPASTRPTAVLIGGTDFGTVQVGQTQGLLATLKNTSSTLPLNIKGISVTGAGVTRGTQGNCSASLAASTSCTIDLYWSPLTTGGLSGALTISDNEASGGQTIALTGNAVLPSPSSSITGTSAFGSVVVGTSGTLTYTLQNTSAYTPLQLSAISLNNGAITWAPGKTGTPCTKPLPQTLAPNTSCTVDITWAPTAIGALADASLTVTDNASDSPHQYLLSGTAIEPPDPYWANVSYLLHMDGANGSNSFIDAKGHGFTAVGSPSITTSTSKFGGASAWFNGHSYIKSPYTAGLVFPGDFTVELWANISAHMIYGGLLSAASPSSITGWQLVFDNTSNNVSLQAAGGILMTSSVPLPMNSWAHIAMVRQGRGTNNMRLYINGNQVATTTYTGTFDSGGAPLYIGIERTVVDYVTGYIDDVRITNGVARYTSPTFALPSAPFSNR